MKVYYDTITCLDEFFFFQVNESKQEFVFLLLAFIFNSFVKHLKTKTQLSF